MRTFRPACFHGKLSDQRVFTNYIFQQGTVQSGKSVDNPHVLIKSLLNRLDSIYFFAKTVESYSESIVEVESTIESSVLVYNESNSDFESRAESAIE